MVNLLHEEVSENFYDTWLRDISMQFFEVVNKVCLHVFKTNLCSPPWVLPLLFLATDEEATVKIILIFEVMRKSTA